MDGTRERTEVTVVHSLACHYCADAEHVLAALAREFRLAVTFVLADTERGRDLVAEYRASMYPVVLVDGVFFSSGRLPRNKLRKLLQGRTAQAAT